MTTNETVPVRPGDLLAGKYRVEQVLGAGGMGVVVAAKHEQLDERVALKFLLPQCAAHPEVVARFAREGRAAAKIKSEHVARVRDVGTLETGAPYLVMEHLAGCTLSGVLEERGPLHFQDAVDYVLQACEALAEAHTLGIVHRDLKPSNLFVTTRADGSECVKVLDFGISKVQADGTGADITRTAASLGSPLYMSPEQMTAPKTVDGRSDIWALGVVLFELLTRAYPFEGESMPQLCIVIVTQPPVLPRTLRADIPPALEAVILKCLEKPAETRFQNIGELVRALAPFAPSRSNVSIERVLRIAPGTVHYVEAASPLASPSARTMTPLTPLPRLGTPVPGTGTGPTGTITGGTGTVIGTVVGVGSHSGIGSQSHPSLHVPKRSSLSSTIGIVMALVAVVGVLAGIGTCYIGRRPAPPPSSIVAAAPPEASSAVPAKLVVADPEPSAAITASPSLTVAPPPAIPAGHPVAHPHPATHPQPPAAGPTVIIVTPTVPNPPATPSVAKPPSTPSTAPQPSTPKANPFDLRK